MTEVASMLRRLRGPAGRTARATEAELVQSARRSLEARSLLTEDQSRAVLGALDRCLELLEAARTVMTDDSQLIESLKDANAMQRDCIERLLRAECERAVGRARREVRH